MAKSTAKGYRPLYDKYLKRRDELHGRARDFLAEVEQRAPGRREEAQALVDLIIRNWDSVRPKTRVGLRSWDDPFERRAAVLDRADWPEVDAEPLHAALAHCGNSFNIARAYYNSLAADEKRLVRAGVRR